MTKAARANAYDILQHNVIAVIHQAKKEGDDKILHNAIVLIQRFMRKDTGPSLEEISKAVCDYYDVDEKDLKSKSRMQSLAVPRSVAMYLMLEMTTIGSNAIGRYFNRDHATAIHARKRIMLRSGYKMMNDTLKAIKKAIK